MSQNRSGSTLLVDQVKQRRASRSKPHLPIFQRFSFSVGHVLNDAVVGAWVSYMLIFQTKVLGISNRTAGFLWIVSSSVDSVLCIVVGYVCDNYRFPFLAKYYGKRKSFHLLGTVLVAGFFPFLMMPCFVCGEDSSEWILGIYYATIMIIHNIGWALSQVTHLALIPEIAKRPSEMVELHALRHAISGFTFLSGIFMYAITWIVLRTDGGDESISSSQWKDFMEIAVTVVGTGCFFSLIFHLGTKEPLETVVEKNKGPSGSFIGRERARSRTATLPLPDKAVGVFCLYDESELGVTPAQTESMEVIQEEQGNTVLENGTVEDRSSDPHGKKDVETTAGLDKGQGGNEFSFSNPAFQTDEKLDMESEETVTSDLSEDSETQPRTKHTESKKDNDFSFSNPAFKSEDKQSTDSEIYSRKKQKKSQTEKSEYLKPTDYISPETRPRSLSSRRSRGSSFTKGTDTSYSGVSVIIEEVNEHETKSSKTTKTWIDWFKTPMFYKISFAYMCARLVQVLNASYVPLYLTETLGFEKESIAYFPLVILISGVFSSLCAKKLDKMLGEKWTYCIASLLVIGSSAWFYLQGESGRNAAYCAAILVGCGGSVMYVTSLALAGKLIGDNKESGAFVFASMSVFAKLACGGSILVTQELFPTGGATGEYVRYVFSLGPGAGSLLGFVAVIAFLPATVRCRKVVHTVDCSVQTEETTEALYAYDNPAAVDNNYKGNEFVVDISDKARVVN
ncbi:hypothetical protein ACROYT_G019596 [Oculina patagonica]